MSNLTTGIESVDKIASLNIRGNIIPHAWFSALRMPSGRTDINGILILSEIVYWHRPRIVRDEYTGAVTAVKKRFKADLLQRSYDSFAEQFGLTKRQVTDAIKRLEEGGLISRVFRNIEQNGVVLSNVLFIELHADNVIGITNICDTPHEYSGEVSQINVTPPTNIRETYTKITQKTTTDIKNTMSSSSNVDRVAAKPNTKKWQKEAAKQLIDYLNQKTGRRYRHTASNIRLIVARLSEGYTPDDVARVIERKCAEWLNDPQMSQYLRPSTLFNATKFNDYVGQIDTPLPEKRGDQSNGLSWDDTSWMEGMENDPF